MIIQPRPFSDASDLEPLKTSVSSIITETMQRSYWHVGDLMWGIYQNTMSDPRKNVQLWENEQGKLVGFAWVNANEVIIQVTLHIIGSDENDLLEQMLSWVEEHQRASAAGGNFPSLRSEERRVGK